MCDGQRRSLSFIYLEKRKTKHYRMKSHIHTGQSVDKMLHTHLETEQHNVGCKPGQEQREREKLREKILYPIIPALGPGSTEREGRDLPMAAPSVLLFPHLPLPSKRGHRAVRLGRMGKQGRARGFAIGMRFPWKGESSPSSGPSMDTSPAAAHQKGQSGFLGQMGQEEGHKEAPFTN